MNRSIALALALAAAGLAHADEITADPPFTSTLSRAEVVADLVQFRQAGIDPWKEGYNPPADLSGRRTRAEVTAEYIANREAVAAMNGEDSGSAYLSRHAGLAQPDTKLARDHVEPQP